MPAHPLTLLVHRVRAATTPEGLHRICDEVRTAYDVRELCGSAKGLRLMAEIEARKAYLECDRGRRDD